MLQQLLNKTTFYHVERKRMAVVLIAPSDKVENINSICLEQRICNPEKMWGMTKSINNLHFYLSLKDEF